MLVSRCNTKYSTFYHIQSLSSGGNRYYHREDGPAYTHIDGTKKWYQNNVLHRLDGPAFEWPSGAQDWYYEGYYIECDSQEEFERLIKLRAFW